MKNASPNSQDEWTIHTLNIHGVFFERWCQRVITDTPGWSVRSVNYPVEFPAPNGPMRGKESSLDIRAEHLEDDELPALAIECKKNNPDFVNWVFFMKGMQGEPRRQYALAQIRNRATEPDHQRTWDTGSTIRTCRTSLPVCGEARETKSDYLSVRGNDRSKTKTSNAAIQDAAYQVALARQAITMEELRFSGLLGSAPSINALLVRMPWVRQSIVPVIVTTAALYVCDFDPIDVDGQTGEIQVCEASLRECDSLIFEYPLPKHLQMEPGDWRSVLLAGSMEIFTRMHIFVVRSSYVGTFLQRSSAMMMDGDETT